MGGSRGGNCGDSFFPEAGAGPAESVAWGRFALGRVVATGESRPVLELTREQVICSESGENPGLEPLSC